MIQKGKVKDAKRKWVTKGKAKDNKKSKPNPDTKGKKPKTKQPKAKEPKEGQCFFCSVLSHWKRNCKLYLEDKKKRGSETTSIGIYVIEVNLSTSVSCVLDTSCGSHICVNV